MRNGRRGQARLSAVSAPNGASARTKPVPDAPLPAGHGWTCRAGLAHGALLRNAALASGYAGAAFDFRPSCRRPAARPGKTMSEAAPALSSSLHARALPVRRNRLNSLEALERGFALFRSTFVREGWRYYIGSAPLLICFIPMWVVNGQIRLSDGVVLMEAALLASGYLLRVCMVASYMQRVRERAFATPKSKPVGVTARAAAVGRVLAWKVALSAGALSALPTFAGASWFYSACNLPVLRRQRTVPKGTR